MRTSLLFFLCSILLFSCQTNQLEKKGFQVNEIVENEEGEKVTGLPIDSLQFTTRPRNVLLTYHNDHRLIPIYKVNRNLKTKETFTGSNQFHRNWNYDEKVGNNWNHNFMPGYSVVYGYNFINLAHYDISKGKQNELFERPVLIRNVYYPAFSNDTLNHVPVHRNHYLVSVYDEDTNKDGYLNVKDLRRFYLFDLHGNKIKALVPKNYSVMNSEYDSANDFMYIFAKQDQNKNGQMDEGEPIHIFWISLAHPEKTGDTYLSE